MANLKAVYSDTTKIEEVSAIMLAKNLWRIFMNNLKKPEMSPLKLGE